jgi:hypothetical protein
MQGIMKRLHYRTNCVNTPEGEVPHLSQMIQESRDITRATFLKHVDCDELRECEAECGYAAHPSQGLTMAADWSVSYHRSKFNGRLAYYFRWSAIEFYFVEGDES